MSQMLLLADPRPLDERLGKEFFRNAPKCAGVYLMRDASDKVLYVGKANNLQQRLHNYRIANPDRMPRRHLRMVREVARIELQFCSGEYAALKRESKLLRSLKPKFNRAGVWPGKTRFIAWRQAEEQLELALVEIPEAGWRRFGPLDGSAIQLHQALTRTLWLAVNPARTIAELPMGWTRNRNVANARIHCGDSTKEIHAVFEFFFWEAPGTFTSWLETKFANRVHPFERGVIEEDLETLNKFSARHERFEKKQLALL